MDTRYDSHRFTAEGQTRADAIKQQAERLALLLDQVPGRAASVALTHLQTTVMFGVRAVAEHHHE